MNKLKIAKELVKLAKSLIASDEKVFNYLQDTAFPPGYKLPLKTPSDSQMTYGITYYLEFPCSDETLEKVHALINDFRNYDGVKEIKQKSILTTLVKKDWRGNEKPCYKVNFNVTLDPSINSNDAISAIAKKIAGDLEKEGFVNHDDPSLIVNIF